MIGFQTDELQFLWELHFIEAERSVLLFAIGCARLQFLWELHFIEAQIRRVLS